MDELLARYQHRLFRFLMRLVQNQAEAEDLFQQTWLRVMEKIGQYDSRSNFDSWLFAVAHNLAIDHLRKRRETELQDVGLVSRQPNALEELLESERAEALLAAMGGLPAIHREVLTLRFEEGMKLEQIAEVAGIPLSTVKSRLHRALENLRAAVEAKFSGERTV